MRTSFLAFVVSGALGFFLAACGGTAPAKCPSSCSGCCDTQGQCQSGTSTLACGSGGLTCSACGTGQFCQFGLCVTMGTGGGSGGGGGGGLGGGDGGGTGGGDADGGTGGGGAVGGGTGGGGTGGGGTGGGGTGGGAAGRSISLIRNITFHGDTGPATIAGNLMSQPISAVVDTDDAGTWVTRSATVLDAGVAVITDVPAGRTWLKYGAVYIDTQASAVDLSQAAVGRANATRPTLSTPLTLSLTGLEAWGSGNYLSVSAPNAGAFYEPLFSSSAAIASGSTSGSDSIDWLNTRQPLIDASQGDVALVLQSAPRSMSGSSFPYRAVSRAGVAAGLTQANGQAASATVALNPVAENNTLTIDWRVPDLVVATDVSPAATTEQASFAVRALPAGLSGGTLTVTPGLFFLGAAPTQGPVQGAVQYGNPFPATWNLVTYQQTVFRTPVTAMGLQADVITVSAEIAPLGQFNGIAQPHLSPPLQIQVDGRLASAPLSGVGTSPVIAWSLPTLGTPERYTVVAYELVASGSQLQLRAAAQLLTRQTSVRVPPGVITGSGTWVVVVQAEIRGGVDVQTRPFWSAAPTLVNAAVSSPFTP